MGQAPDLPTRSEMRPSGMANLEPWEISRLTTHLRAYLVNAKRFVQGWSLREVEDKRDDHRAVD